MNIPTNIIIFDPSIIIHRSSNSIGRGTRAPTHT